ncbi:MAG: PH domain-containing protein [Planctomycetaceae bacterium]|nr:PH domain-containing protein [Planctomycetaceae bacterium]
MNDAAPSDQQPAGEYDLFREHPAMFKNHPLGFILNIVLLITGFALIKVGGPFTMIASGVSLIIFAQWWVKCIGTTLIVTNEGTTVERGILSKSTNELWHSDVRNVQIQQTFFQRIMNVGTVNVSSGGQADIEIIVHGIPNPHQVHRIIEDERRKQNSL